MDYLKIIGILFGMVLVVVVFRKILFPERPGGLEPRGEGASSEAVSTYDPAARERLIAKIGEQVDLAVFGMPMKGEEFLRLMKEGKSIPTPPLVLVSLEDYFEGNQDTGSIGGNLDPHPGIEGFYSTLKAIRDREDVQDVQVEIWAIEENLWPFSGCVRVFTRASREEVEEWLKPLRPFVMSDGFGKVKPAKAPALEAGMKVYGAWWD